MYINSKCGMGQNKSFYVILITILYNGCVNLSMASEWYVSPWINLSMGYNDNIRLNNSAGKSSSILTYVSPEVTLGKESETSSLELSAKVDFKRYYSIHELDTDNKYLNFKGEKSYDLSKISAAISYSNDTTLEYFIDDIGKSDTKLTRRENKTFDPVWSIGISELTKLRLGYTINSIRYPDVGTIYSDYEIKTYSASIQHKLNESAGMFFNVYSSKYFQGLTSRTTNINYNGITIGASYNISKLFIVSGSLGQQDSDTETIVTQIVPSIRLNTNSKTNLYSLDLERKFELTVLKISYSLSSTPDSLSRLNERNEIKFKLSHRLSARSSISLNSRYFVQKVADSSDTSGDRSYLSINPVYDFKLSKKSRLRASYQYQKIDVTVNNNSETSNSFMFTYSYNWGKIKI